MFQDIAFSALKKSSASADLPGRADVEARLVTTLTPDYLGQGGRVFSRQSSTGGEGMPTPGATTSGTAAPSVVFERDLDAAHKSAVDQFKQTGYFERQASWLLSRFPDARFAPVAGLCRVVSRKEIEAAGWSLTPGRYVGVAPAEVDGEFDFEQTLRDIHVELADLNQRSGPRGGEDSGEPRGTRDMTGTDSLYPLPEGWTPFTVDEIKSPEPSSCVAGPFGSKIRRSISLMKAFR